MAPKKEKKKKEKEPISTTMPLPNFPGWNDPSTWNNPLNPAPTAPKPPPGKPEDALSGEDRNIYDAILATLRTYGLESLAGTLLKFIQEGYSESTITILLQDTKEYKQRFIANEARRKKGLPVLSPREYLETEQAFRQIMSQAGMPVGFYDELSDFTKWLEDDVSPVEIGQRVEVARQLIDTLDPNVRAAFEQWYTPGDMVAYALDRDRAVSILERQFRAAQVGGAAQAQGISSVGRDTAERIVEAGIGADQAAAGFGQAARVSTATQRLAGMYGGAYDEDDAVQEVFFSSNEAAERRRRLASQERAQFRGSAGTTAKSLTARQAGQV